MVSYSEFFCLNLKSGFWQFTVYTVYCNVQSLYVCVGQNLVCTGYLSEITWIHDYLWDLDILEPEENKPPKR